LLESRGIIENGRLSAYGKAVEALPVDRPWAELLVNADDDMVPFLAVMSSIDSLHRMTRAERDLDGVLVAGSDHLSSYNLYSEAYREAGYVGEVYGLPRHLFHPDRLEAWAERRGALMKSIEDAALASASVFRALGMPLPVRMPWAGESVRGSFMEMLAGFMPFDLIIDEEDRAGMEVRVGRDSACGSWGAIAGTVRYFAGRNGAQRAAVEGTQINMDLVRRHATQGAPRVVYEPQHRKTPLRLERTLSYFGFELHRQSEPVDRFPSEQAAECRRVLAESAAKFDARHSSVKRNREAIELVREVHRRSGGATAQLGVMELTAFYEAQLGDVWTLDEFRATPLVLRVEEFVGAEDLRRYLALPSEVEIRGRMVPIEYGIEAAAGVPPLAVARLRLPERMVKGLLPEEVPDLDRPLRFVVERGNRGAVRAASLEELHELLEQPWMPEELSYVREDRSRRGSRTGKKGEARGKSSRGSGSRNPRGRLREHARGRRRK
jgi:hypothetical protein